MIYYISDLHFGHKNVIQYDNRPFVSVEQMEAVLIEKWNQRVTNQDIVYILGDFCWQLEQEWIRLLGMLNGRKILIRGNHDLKNMSDKLKRMFVKITDYEEITDNGKHIIMCHYPILFYKKSYSDDCWHFHGHTHNSTDEELLRKEYVRNLVASRSKNSGNRGHIVNVGCMMPYVDFVPRTAEEFIAWWRQEYEQAV